MRRRRWTRWEGAALEALGLFFLTVLLALVVHFAVWLPLLLRLFAGVRPYACYGRVVPASLIGSVS